MRVFTAWLEARRDATKLLKELESGKDIATIKGKNDKYLFKNLASSFLATQRKKCTKAYADKIERSTNFTQQITMMSVSWG